MVRETSLIRSFSLLSITITSQLSPLNSCLLSVFLHIQRLQLAHQKRIRIKRRAPIMKPSSHCGNGLKKKCCIITMVFAY
ncbi:uncharacterized protein DEA37_0015262 [Paragonimus westermani]|uniref:Uncharacterized protein n=1 Tax=Paragonimus westermani TaxID=34504 RepID=A0A5J4NAG2_9TREM|nr:uncharacterized protein DEA37_0015262 [Paragonimus westermani]